jgi:hypothetical protein
MAQDCVQTGNESVAIIGCTAIARWFLVDFPST